MKQFFSTPKRAILTILFILFCIAMGISGALMGLAMGQAN